MKTELTKKQTQEIVQFLVENCEAFAVILFGSAAKERMRVDSDVDIAYLSHRRISDYERFMMAQRLADVLKRDVDLIDFYRASTVFQAQVVTTGKMLYDGEPFVRQEAFMVALKSYALLNEERSEILAQIENGTGDSAWGGMWTTINRCIARIQEEYAGDPANLGNMTKQDSIILNLQRACEACIDLAMHTVAEKKLGLPQTSKEAFDFLLREQVISEELCNNLKAMVGFRNIAVHDYQAIQVGIVQAIIEKHLNDFPAFADRIRIYMAKSSEPDGA